MGRQLLFQLLPVYLTAQSLVAHDVIVRVAAIVSSSVSLYRGCFN